MVYQGPNLDVFPKDLENRLVSAIESIQGEVKIKDITPRVEKKSKDWKRVFMDFSEVYAFLNGEPDIAYFVGKDGKIYELSQFKNLRLLTEGQKLEKIDLHPLTVLDTCHTHLQMNAEFGKEFPIIYHGKRICYEVSMDKIIDFYLNHRCDYRK